MQKKTKDNLLALPVEASEWLTDLPDCKYSLLLSPEWITAMTDDNSKAVYINFVRNGEIVGKIAGLACNYGKIKGTQLYFYASPALKNNDTGLFNDCHTALYRFARKNRYSRIVLGSYDQQHQQHCTAPHFFTTKRYEYIVDLESEPDFGRGFKQNVRRAEKQEAGFEQNSSEEMLNHLFELLNITKEHRVSKYGNDYNPLFLRNLTKKSLLRLIASGMAKLYTASVNNQTHIVSCNLEENGRIYALLLGSDNRSYELGLPAFLSARMISNAKQRGFRYYNPGGGTEEEGGSGLEKFKLSMGAQKVYFYGATTNFICFPQKLLNPLMNMGRSLSDKNPVINMLKKRFN